MAEPDDNPARRTRLLFAMVIAALVAAVPCWMRLASARSAANAAQRDLMACRSILADLKGADALRPPTPGEAADVDRRVREAADAAGVRRNLSSVEPGLPRATPGGGTSEMPVFLRFESLALRDLCAFLVRLSADDPRSRVKSLELSPAADDATARGPATTQPSERWTADVTIAYPVRAGAEGASP